MALSLRRFSDPVAFQQHTSAHLGEREAENNLVIGILASVVGGQYKDFPPYMAAVESDGDIVQVLLRTPPHPVLISYRGTSPSKEEVRLVVEDLYSEYGHDLAGVTGDKDLVSLYVKAWEHVTGQAGRLRNSLRIYRASKIRQPVGVAGAMRPITEVDRDLLVEWLWQFNKDAFHEEPERDMIYATVERYLSADSSQRGLVLWEAGGEAVSMAGYSGPTPHGIRIVAVYTPPAGRNRGYASACVGALSQHLLDSGHQFCFLFADLSNPVSNHLYQKLGYEPVSDVDSYLFS